MFQWFFDLFRQREYTSELKWVVYDSSKQFHELHDDYELALSRAEEIARELGMKEGYIDTDVKDGEVRINLGEIGSVHHPYGELGRAYYAEDGRELLLCQGVIYHET